MFPWQQTKELGNLSMFLLTHRNPDVHREPGMGKLAVTSLATGHCRGVSLCVCVRVCARACACYAANGI